MPQELPGFYYDGEKNRYFPIKGPIPGSSSTPNANRKRKVSTLQSIDKSKSKFGLGDTIHMRSSEVLMLQGREICGNTISSRKGNPKFNFQIEYQKKLASQPVIWKYHGTEKRAHLALEQVNIDVITSHGVSNANVLLTTGLNCTLCLFEVGGAREGHWINCRADRVWPCDVGPQGKFLPKDVQRNILATLGLPSDITCINILYHDDPSSNQVLITTLGSEGSRGSVYHLHFREPVDYSSAPLAWSNIDEITSFNRTIWTADSNPDGTRAVLGTNEGAIMVDLETGVRSSVCRCESDVLSVQVDYSGNFVLCGLRNGAILTLDARQRPEDYSARLGRHKISFPSSKSSSKSIGKSTKKWFEIKGNLHADRTIFMPSSISSLVSLKRYDQYFCASSMDGSIKLYDHRLMNRGAVQSYEGNVNSHTRLHLGVDPAERMLVSGGEDCKLRMWSIKSGELLFENKVMNQPPSVVCWPKTQEMQNWDAQSWGAWVGSQEGLFYVNWPWNNL